MRELSAHEILSSAFERKVKRKKGYSQRGLARDLGVSAAFVTNLLSGKKALPKDRLQSLTKVLELDPLERRELSRALILDKTKSPTLRALLQKEVKNQKRSRKTISEEKSDQVLENWWMIPVMESFSLSGSVKPTTIQRRLGISKAQWEKAVRVLLSEGMIQKTKDGYEKREDHLYFSTARSKASVRAFHKNMINKAVEELGKTQESDFQRRLITGYTFALAPEQLEEIKVMIMQFMDKSSKKATHGECKDVYQLNVQLVPLTKPR